MTPTDPRNRKEGVNPFASVPTEQMRWSIRVPEGNEYGPVDRQTLLAWAEEGRIDSHCLLQSSQSPEWLPAQTVLRGIQPIDGPSAAAPQRGHRRPWVHQKLASLNKNLPDSATKRTMLIALVGVFTFCPIFSAWAWKRSSDRLFDPAPLRRIDETMLRFMRALGLAHAGVTALAIVIALFVLLLQQLAPPS